ncbi:MAG: ribonuclease Z [Promethearchaeota archaeon]
MEIIFLGTSGAVPNKLRNLPSIAILYEGRQLLFDAGEDVQRRFEGASLKFNAPLTIFISHMHGDHIIGLPGLLFHFTLIQRTEEVTIYGPPGIYLYLLAHKLTVGLKPRFLKNIFEIHYDKNDKNNLLKYDFQSEFNPGQQQTKEIEITDGIICETGDYKIKCIPVCHSVQTFGFKFIEKPRQGKFNPKRAEDIGIPMGRLWKKMQMEGPIEFKGKMVDPVLEGITGPKRDGIIISYSSDTKKCKALIDLAENSDVFICESTYREDLKELAEQKKHMTALQSAEIAVQANVHQLILTHISTRYSDEADQLALLNEARSIFPNTILAYDLLRIDPRKNNKN